MYDKIAAWILDNRLPKDLSDVELITYKKLTYRTFRPPAQIYDGDAISILSALAERGIYTELRVIPAKQSDTLTRRYQCNIVTATATYYLFSDTLAGAVVGATTKFIESI